jgi:hypothetical protein
MSLMPILCDICTLILIRMKIKETSFFGNRLAGLMSQSIIYEFVRPLRVGLQSKLLYSTYRTSILSLRQNINPSFHVLYCT